MKGEISIAPFFGPNLLFKEISLRLYWFVNPFLGRGVEEANFPGSIVIGRSVIITMNSFFTHSSVVISSISHR